MNLYKECAIKRTLQLKSLYTAFEAVFDAGYSFVGEAHDFWELVYVQSGTIGVVADDNVYILSEGKLVLHPPMQFHRIWSEGTERSVVDIISFDAQWSNRPTCLIFELDKSGEGKLLEALNGIKNEFIMENRVVACCRSGHEAHAQIAVNKLEEILLSLSENNVASKQGIAPIDKKYAEIVRILTDNIDKSMSLTQIADMCNMSVSNLKKVFYKYSGMGIKHYFNEMKARQAAQFLREGYNVKETSLMLGFCDQNYFSMFFKRMTGKSPTEYIK